MHSSTKHLEKKIRGQIIRIPDAKTVVINLGRKHGIRPSSVFSILGEPETIVDPFADKELGRVIIAKGRVKASHVEDEFTIATTEWKELVGGGLMITFVQDESEVIVHEGDLLVDSANIQPWKARSEEPVKVGDTVEVTVTVPEQEDTNSDAPF
jgi:hypothetical protein